MMSLASCFIPKYANFCAVSESLMAPLPWQEDSPGEGMRDVSSPGRDDAT
jgi:hypothetical protein